MDWDQNEELVEQILRTGMYAKLYDEETTYGYLTYLTYRVEDTLFTWKKKSDVDGFWADLTWEEYISFCGEKKHCSWQLKGCCSTLDRKSVV